MPNKKSIDEAKRERALKLLEESEPETAEVVREALKNRSKPKEIAQVANLITRYKPKLRYARLSDPVLLYFWALLEQRITGCIADAVGKYFDPVAIFLPGRKLKSAVSMVHKWPLLTLINEFHGAGVDENQTFQLVKLVLERTALLMEYEKRMASRIIGREPRQLEIGRLRKLLSVDKIKSYRPEEGAEDLQQKALLRAYDAYEKQCNILVETPNKTIPQFPVKDGASWDGIHAARWETEVKQSLRKVLPILYGTSEEIPENVRLYLREEWKKERGRRAIMDGVDNFPKLKTAPTEAWRADWDWTKSARENRHEDIRREVHPSPDENTKATPDVSAKMFEVLKEAQRHKRWGPKAIMAFKYYLKGATEEEAARRAGITDRTFRNNI